MRVPVVAALTVLSLLAAGCVSGPVDTASTEPAAVAEGWWTHAVPSGEGHDHSDRKQHENLTTPNFQVIGYDPLTTDALGSTATGMGCGGTGVTAEGRKIALVHTISTEVAFIVADVTDPAHPVKLGEYLMPNAVIWDATITPDGMHALVGAYPLVFGGRGVVLPTDDAMASLAEKVETPEFWRFEPMWRDACTGEVSAAGPEQYLPFGPGIVMVGLQDPTNPTFESWVSQPVIGPHSVGAQDVDGRTIVSSSVTNLVHEVSYYTFFDIVDTPAGSQLVPFAVIQAPGNPPPGALNGHTDVYVAKHPITGQTLAYLANWDEGMSIYDLDAPTPTLLSTWKDADMGSLHTTLPMTVAWGDKHYTFAGQEVGEPVDLPSGWIYILDTTDPANPVEVGRWTLPVKPKWDDGGLQFSPHYVAVQNRTLFVTNYHGGMWAVDINDLANPQAVGIFVPAVDSSTPHEDCPCGPSIEDVLVDEETGILTLWDGAGGVYQLRFDDAMPSVKAPAWPVAG